jgi:hypothetical protein
MQQTKKRAAVIIILIILNISTYLSQRSMKENFANQIMNLNNQIMNLNNQLNSYSNQINKNIESIKNDRKWTVSESYKLLDYDDKTNQIKTQINWSFKELSSNSRVYLLYGERSIDSGNVEKWDKVKVDELDKLNYQAEISLSPEKNYALKVQEESNNSFRGQELMNIDLNNAINNRFNFLTGDDSQKGPRYRHHLYILNNFKDVNFLKIKSAKAEIYVKGALENTVELNRGTDLEGEVGEWIIKKFDLEKDKEIWLNDNAIWVKGEENWVKTGANEWQNKSQVYNHNEIRTEITIIDNMGKTYKRSIPQYN